MKDKQCKKCGAYHFNYLNAMECCDELKEEKINNEKHNIKTSK